jgi:aminopeptidase N
MLEVRHRRDIWRFKDVREPVVPSLNRGFSAPVNLTVSLSDADLAFLMARDSDSFNRWQATQDYACRILVSAVSAIAKGARPERPAAFLAALTAAACDEGLDPAFRAQLLSLPTEGDVARIIGRDLDPAAIHKSVLWLQRTTASTMGATLEALYARHGSSAPYEPTGEQAARRALRLAALSLLTRRGRTGDIERLVTHYNAARNATDEISALGLIANQRAAVRIPALERYHTRWKHDHIMIDHWFSCQASATLAGVLQTTKRLTRHPQFSLRNPNKVRALLFAFATANPLHFNRPDGKGYAYIAEMVQELDTINPQMAARLAGAFRNWSQLESGRRQLAKRALKFIQARRTLSKDVAEVVGKILT